MTLNDFLELFPAEQEMMLTYEYFTLRGDKEALACMLCEDVYKGAVINAEAEGNLLKVWVKERVENV